MADDQHSADVFNIREGDFVEIVTTTGEVFVGECTLYNVSNSVPRSGEVRETTDIKLETMDFSTHVSITKGLTSPRDDVNFPIHRQVWNIDEGRRMGHVEEVSIYGEMEA